MARVKSGNVTLELKSGGMSSLFGTAAPIVGAKASQVADAAAGMMSPEVHEMPWAPPKNPPYMSEVKTVTGKDGSQRPAARVWTSNYMSRYDNNQNNTLRKAIDAGK